MSGRPTIEERLSKWSMPVTESGCLLWIGALDNDGYGRVFYKGKSRKAHRVAYEVYRGTMPSGLEPDHTCRVRSCINWLHLEPVTHRENMQRSPVKFVPKNEKRTHCVHGHSLDQCRVDSRGKRVCRTCANDRSRKYYHAKQT